MTRTQFSQIVPPSRNWNRESDSDQVRHIDCCLLVIEIPPPAFTQARFPRTAWSLIHALGGIGDPEELHGNKGYRLSNALTLGIVVHTAFTDLDLWFEEDLVSAMPFSDFLIGLRFRATMENGPPNTYWVRSKYPLVLLPTTPVTFVSSSPELELPDPRYLRLHAAVCRVADLSGAGRLFAYV